ncbi:MAG TPA: sensor domain-containing phosphodiesterase [Rubrivivax sp.]|nr:sensor domain-containing phosphodiesterase [Rubrivivax sp.]
MNSHLHTGAPAASYPIPGNEAQRLAVLEGMCLLDTPPDPVLDQLTRLAVSTFASPIALVSLVAQDRQWFKSRVGLAARETPRDVAFCAYAIVAPEPLVVLDALQDDRFAANPLVTGAPHIRFYAGAPLTTREGTCLGTLCILDTQPRGTFDEAQRRLLEQLAGLVVSRIENLRSIGYVDPLTGLPNRTRFVDDIGQRLHDAGPDAGVYAVAVDACGSAYFDHMVQALGHDYAEGYLVAARDRLRSVLPPRTTTYRIGSTMFGLLREADDEATLTPLFDVICGAFDRPLEHQGIPHNPRPSIAAMRLGGGAQAADVYRALLAVADAVRLQGRAWGFYERHGDEAQKRAFSILSQLPAALDRDDRVSLHYQPRIDLATGRCIGAEALIRWSDPTMGAVSPGEFIPLAEKTALIARVTRWTMAHAVKQAAAWQRAGHGLTVSINVSAVDLDEEGFADDVCAVLQRHGVDPRQIELEFTESALGRNDQRLSEHFARLRALGLQIAIDDFGTGFSNFNYLKQIPATALKIDQSFIRSVLTDDRDRAIVPSMIRLGHDLGFRVVAEGIETQAACELVRRWGCDEGQGYWIARPMPAVQFDEWLGRRLAAPTAS